MILFAISNQPIPSNLFGVVNFIISSTVYVRLLMEAASRGYLFVEVFLARIVRMPLQTHFKHEIYASLV